MDCKTAYDVGYRLALVKAAQGPGGQPVAPAEPAAIQPSSLDMPQEERSRIQQLGSPGAAQPAAPAAEQPAAPEAPATQPAYTRPSYLFPNAWMPSPSEPDKWVPATRDPALIGQPSYWDPEIGRLFRGNPNQRRLLGAGPRGIPIHHLQKEYPSAMHFIESQRSRPVAPGSARAARLGIVAGEASGSERAKQLARAARKSPGTPAATAATSGTAAAQTAATRPAAKQPAATTQPATGGQVVSLGMPQEERARIQQLGAPGAGAGAGGAGEGYISTDADKRRWMEEMARYGGFRDVGELEAYNRALLMIQGRAQKASQIRQAIMSMFGGGYI